MRNIRNELYYECQIQYVCELDNSDMEEFTKYAKQYVETKPYSYVDLLDKVIRLLSRGHSFETIKNKIKEEVMKKEKKIMPTGRYANLFLDEIKNITFTQKLPTFDKNQVKDVIFNDPATIVFWKDGTKTVVKCQKDKGDTYNPELGLAMCIIKKMCDNKGNYNDVFNKWLPTEDE